MNIAGVFNNLFKEPIPIADWYTTGIAVVLIFIIIIIAYYLKQIFVFWKEEWSRKFVHICTGILAAIAPYYFNSAILLLSISLLFLILDFTFIKKGILKDIFGQRFSYGTVYFPLANILLIIFCWPDYKHLITLGMLLFAIPDALAAVAGNLIRRNYIFVPIKDKKSIVGSTIMFLFSLIIIYIFFYTFSKDNYGLLLHYAFMAALIITVVEMMSSSGSDNLYVPITGVLIFFIFQNSSNDLIMQIGLAILLSLIIAIISFHLKFLSLSGSLMTFLLAVAIFGLGGLQWAVPILTFFILSSLLSKAGKSRKQKFKNTFEKTGIRDHIQVLVNGGIGGFFVIISYFYNGNNAIFFYLYLISLSVAVADTWATEIGILFKWKPYLITTFKKVNPGLSGAVSLHGTIGGILGSTIIAYSGIIFLNKLNYDLFFIIIFLGVFGSIIDSILGATIQGQYVCSVCKKYTEKKIHCNYETKLIRGYKFINNDTVNFLSILFTVSIFILFN
ncbi:MAG: DUF92 domain-containing protein [Calditrichaceae bacterium]|nr:DUF92 domain-containing protein [Calditrichaceae bacterium]MBN2709881.1 DUF92 domain-containing protein [Calditrichaceae bacterium]RQV92637.1 MAG: DUF92 domain-containing protein [Calditrichota bacterium]